MVYGSVAKGYRGGGFNAASVPPQFSTYDGDTVWTYEIGGKGELRRRPLAHVGAPSTTTTTRTSSARTRWRSARAAASSRSISTSATSSPTASRPSWTQTMTENWTLRGSVTLMHARITDQSGWLAVDGHAARDRSPAVPAGLELQPRLGPDDAGRRGGDHLEPRAESARAAGRARASIRRRRRSWRATPRRTRRSPSAMDRSGDAVRQQHAR